MKIVFNQTCEEMKDRDKDDPPIVTKTLSMSFFSLSHHSALIICSSFYSSFLFSCSHDNDDEL